MNWYIIPIAALIPIVIGFVWYSNMLFGNAWIKASGFDPSKEVTSKMGRILTLTYVFGLLLALQIITLVIHQVHIGSLFAEIPGSDQPGSDLMVFMEKYGKLYRTFKHGAFHGVLAGIFFALPVVAINALFERRSGRYILIHAGYWTITIALMGGVICQFM